MVTQVTTITRRRRVNKTVKRTKRNNRRGGQVPRRMAGCPDGKRYVECVLGASKGAAKIPDGDTHHSVPLEFTSTCTISPDDQGRISVACWPGLPGSLRVNHGSGTFQNRSNVPIILAPNAMSSTGAQGFTIPFTDFTRTAVATDLSYNGDVAIEQARVVAYSLEVTQVGPVLNQQGQSVCARVPINHDASLPMHYSLVGPDVYLKGHTFPNLTSAQLFRGIHGSRVLTFENVSTFPMTEVRSATVPCKLIGIPGDTRWQPVRADYNAIRLTDTTKHVVDTTPFCRDFDLQMSGVGGCVGGGDNGIDTVWPLLPNDSDFCFVGDFWTPNDCEALVWAGAALGSGTTFEVKATLCVEAVIYHGASVYRPFISPPAERDDQAVAVVEAVGRIMPPGVPKADGMSSWWGAITSAVAGIGDLVGQMGIPVVSPMAGVATKFMRAVGLSS